IGSSGCSGSRTSGSSTAAASCGSPRAARPRPTLRPNPQPQHNSGTPPSTSCPTYTPTGIQLRNADFSHRAFRDDVLKHVESGGRLVDVRSPAEFNGELLAPAGTPAERAP